MTLKPTWNTQRSCLACCAGEVVFGGVGSVSNYGDVVKAGAVCIEETG